MRIDVKSVIIGLLLGLCVMLTRGAAPSAATPNRYQISAVQRSDPNGTPQTVVFVLDQQTGKVYGYVKGDKGWEHPQGRSFLVKDSDME